MFRCTVPWKKCCLETHLQEQLHVLGRRCTCSWHTIDSSGIRLTVGQSDTLTGRRITWPSQTLKMGAAVCSCRVATSPTLAQPHQRTLLDARRRFCLIDEMRNHEESKQPRFKVACIVGMQGADVMALDCIGRNSGYGTWRWSADCDKIPSSTK